MTAVEISTIIDRLPPDTATSVDYYLWIATWQPTDAVRAAYRATPAARALHRRAVAASLVGDVAKRDTATLTPLLLLNAIPVAEELFIEIATAAPIPILRDFMTAFWELIATLPRPSRLLYDPTIREPFRDWTTNTLIPWIATTIGPRFAELWTSTILPTWEAVRARPLPSPLSADTATELTAVAWAPERVVDWCLSADEASALRGRWVDATASSWRLKGDNMATERRQQAPAQM